jgi:hypothetical protein
MGGITAAVPEPDYEAMVMDDGCPLVDGYCRSIHGCGYLPRADGAAALRSIPAWDVSGRAHHLCQELGRPADEPPPCAACALPALERAGIRVGKFGGRGLPLRQRLEKLRFLRAAQALASDAERADLYARSFGPATAIMNAPPRRGARYGVSPFYRRQAAGAGGPGATLSGTSRV